MPDRSLGEEWESIAPDWVAWARAQGHDSYWRFHRDAFFALLPPPGKLTLDIGCGEGRVARDLKALGHDIMAFDVSPTLVTAAREADPSMSVQVADAAQLPLDAGCADLAVAFMSLQDVEDMPAAIAEIGRVLCVGGKAGIAIVHPINSAGKFESEDPDARFMIEGSYFEPRRYSESVERDGLRITFSSRHWPLQAYFEAMAAAGLVVETLREVPVDVASARRRHSSVRWQRLPLFVDLRAAKR